MSNEISPKQTQTLSDRSPPKKNRSSKKQMMSQMKNKMRTILAKVQQLENQKKEDRQQLEKLLGSGKKLQQLTVQNVTKFEQMRSSSVGQKPDKKQIIQDKKSKRKGSFTNQNRCKTFEINNFNVEKQYVEKVSLANQSKIYSLKNLRKQARNETVKNFIIAVISGIILVFVIMFTSDYQF